jgi:hypothetical protein
MCHPPFIHPSNLYSTTNQLLHNHFQNIQQPRSNHDSTILRVESKNDFDTTIPHSRFSKSDNVELHGLGSSVNCLGRRVTSYTTRDAKEIAKLLTMLL